MNNWYINDRKMENLLMEKYGLTEEAASHVCRQFEIIRTIPIEDHEAIRPTSDPEANKAAIQKVIDAELDWHKPKPNVYGIIYKIKRINFIMDGGKVSIDDKHLIEQIRKLIADNAASFQYTPRYRKQSSYRSLLCKIAQYLIDQSNKPEMYQKQLFAGNVMGEFDKDFREGTFLKNRNIVDKVKNLFK